MAHAKLSPSGASRWMACTPSANLEAQFPDRAGVFAEEGTFAHALAEFELCAILGFVHKPATRQEIPNFDKHYSESLQQYVDDYVSFVIEQLNEARKRTPDALISLECKIDMSRYIPEGFGTADVIIIGDGVLHMIDLKYGKGVPVAAAENKQLMVYGLGALDHFDGLYDIDTVRLSIHQPRIDNNSTWEILVGDLLLWADQELRPRAQLAFDGEGEFVVGNHCQFCKARAKCKAFANYNLELAKHEFKPVTLLSDDDVTDILNRAKLFESWLTAVQDDALHEAVVNGKKWPGFKIVEGRSNRKYTSDEAVIDALRKAKISDEAIFKPAEIKGITALEKELGKKPFNELTAGLISKPPGKPALVPESDKRPEFSTVATDFAMAVEDDN